jgi:heptosyltransferase-2
VAPDRPVERILIKQLNWLGDLVMGMPATRAVHAAYPEAHLAVLVRHELASFFDGFEWIDEVIPYSVRSGAAAAVDQLRLASSLRKGRYDLAVVLPRSFRSALWPALAGVPQRVGLRSQWRSPLLTRRATLPQSLLRQHQANDYLYLLESTLGISGSAADNRIDVAERHTAAMSTWLAERRRSRGRLVAVAAAAAYGPAKEWPAAHYAGLIDRLAGEAIECVLVGAPSERRRCEEVAAGSRDGALIAAGETSVGQLAALLALCDGFVGNDSGAMHVAAALGVPTVGIFGSTRPDRTAPLGARTAVVSHPIECSPCMQRTCRFGHYDCLGQVTVDRVRAALESAIGPGG